MQYLTCNFLLRSVLHRFNSS